MISVTLPRKVAREREITFYFTGEPCARGHLANRRAKDTRCVACDVEKMRRRYREQEGFKERTLASNKRRAEDARAAKQVFLASPEGQEQLRQESAEKNRRRTEIAQQRAQRQSRRRAERYANDPEYRDRVQLKNKEWYEANIAKTQARVTRRRLAKLMRSPRWMTSEMLAAIAGKYEEARSLSIATGVPHEVDHIVPLQGTRVSGLHVPWNLRVVEKSENRSKHNRFEA